MIILALTYKINTQVVKADTRSETWSIKTALDSFVIKKDRGQYFIDKQKVQMKAFNELRDIVNNKLAFADQDIGNNEDGCSQPRRTPDIQISRTRPGQKDSKEIAVYIKERSIVVNQRCSSIEGNGIFALPMHREWYIGPKTTNVEIGTQRKLVFDRSKPIVYRESANSQDRKIKLLVNGPMPDWDKIDLFESKLGFIEVSGRRNLSYVENNPHFTFTTNNKTYTFYEIRDPRLVWALKLPNKPFLILSRSFSWNEFNLEHVADSKSSTISALRNSKLPENERIKALKELRNYWNTSFQRILFTILKDEDEPTKLRQDIAEFLIQKPTSLNKETLLKTLIRTQDPSLREYISQRLRIFYPKGKAISVNDADNTVSRKINVWRSFQYQ